MSKQRKNTTLLTNKIFCKIFIVNWIKRLTFLGNRFRGDYNENDTTTNEDENLTGPANLLPYI